jgi:hypothetical protein
MGKKKRSRIDNPFMECGNPDVSMMTVTPAGRGGKGTGTAIFRRAVATAASLDAVGAPVPRPPKREAAATQREGHRPGFAS